MNPSTLRAADGVTLLKYAHPWVAHVSYLLIDKETATAAVIDPYGDLDPYLEDAWRLDAAVKHVFLTQVHDDFNAGFSELRDRACATVYAGAWVRLNGEFMPLKEGDALEFGRVRLRIVEIPGHRLEALAILVYDVSRNEPVPYAALTGETLLLGDVGRPNPRPSDGFDVSELAAMLHDSLNRKVIGWPDSTQILPAHESEIETMGEDVGTIRGQMGCNPGLQAMSREEFVRRVTAGMAEEEDRPAEPMPRLRPVSLAEAIRALRAGAQVVDARDPNDFAAAHVEGSLNVPAAAAFEGWVDAILDAEGPIILVASPGQEASVAARLARAGFEQVAGYLRDGIQTMESRPDLMRRRRRITFPALGPRLVGGPPSFLLDVRPERTKPMGPSLAAYAAPLEHLRYELAAFPRGPEIIVCDDMPYRSSAAASFLMARGFDNVTDVAGGLALWGRDRP